MENNGEIRTRAEVSRPPVSGLHHEYIMLKIYNA